VRFLSHDVSISMKRYAAVKVRGACTPGAGCWKDRAGRARSPRVVKTRWSP